VKLTARYINVVILAGDLNSRTEKPSKKSDLVTSLLKEE
jgi:hypothetical protein